MARPQTVSDEQIAAAAREVFVEHGPNAPVSLVGKRLGVSHAALLQRAGSKRQLMLDALWPGRPPAVDALSAPPPLVGADEALVDILLGLMGFLQVVIPNLVVLRSAGLPVGRPGPGEPPPALIRRLLADWLDQAHQIGALAPQPPQALAEGLLGAIEARCFNGYLGGPGYADGEDRTFVEAVVAGLVAPRSPQKEAR
jgi:AcrR family transcriptional regulator